MSLTLAEVEHIAMLARLELSSEEKFLYREQLSAILDYAARLQQVDTTAMILTEPILSAGPALRPDLPKPGLDRPSALANAPQVENDQFRVPPILE
jgi:aspartyl-tRNA(Asn)/glutamyl-tRNA(Gln) amidotransferase subunit C